jgi:hypothetical protein
MLQAKPDELAHCKKPENRVALVADAKHRAICFAHLKKRTHRPQEEPSAADVQQARLGVFFAVVWYQS